MKDTPEQIDLLEQWAAYRRTGKGTALTQSVMESIRAQQPARAFPPPRGWTRTGLSRIALASLCTAAGIGKVLLVLHFAI
jgi:hypothetical protein